MLGIVLLPMSMATHEMMHLAVFAALGHSATLVTTSWRLRLVDLHLFTVHAAALGPVSLAEQALDNALGPLVAGAVLLLVRWLLRDPVARVAVLANVLVQCFFAVIETGYPLLEMGAHVDVRRSSEAKNCPRTRRQGKPIIVLLATAGSMARSSTRLQ
jgi:hypothetical protein